MPEIGVRLVFYKYHFRVEIARRGFRIQQSDLFQEQISYLNSVPSLIDEQ